MNDKTKFRNLKTSQRTICEAAAKAAGILPPYEFMAWLGGTFASIVGSLPEDYWQKGIVIEPCGRHGCDCHIELQPKTKELFTFLRDDFLKHEPKAFSE
jgi:hypothetical protein